jgi:hypothetical protein
MKLKIKLEAVNGNQVKRKLFSALIVILMISNIFILLWSSINVTAADLVVSGTYVVSGTENWDDVTVTGTGKLIVPIGATLNALSITMEPGSIFEATGGSVVLSNSNPGEDVFFRGSCDFFNVTDFSDIILASPDGGNTIGTSQGGDAELNITGSAGITFANSTINATGGDGFDLPASTSNACNAWTYGSNLNGYVAAGGNATIHLNLINLTSPLVVYLC